MLFENVIKSNVRVCFTLLLATVLVVLDVQYACADIFDRNTPQLRIRVGSNAGSGDTVEYAPGLPPLFTAIGGFASEAEHTSTNVIAGGSGSYTVRYITDANRKGAAEANVNASFSYDSSAGMTCITPASCGTTNISFTHIAWDARDNDTLNSVLQYDGSANQVFQTQADSNPANNATDTRHRNFYRYRYINNVIYPAGTYRGTVTINGAGS